MSEDRLYHLIEIFIQVIGLGFVIFKFGRYFGEANQMFKQLFHSDTKHEEKLEQVDKDLTGLKIKVASIRITK